MEFTILGKTQLHVAQRPVALGASKQRGLLALLLLSVGRPVPIPMIAEQLWPDRSREQIRGNLQALVSRVRSVLRRAGVAHQLRIDGDTYRLGLDPQLIDYHRFRKQADAGRMAARSGDHVQARVILRDAIDMWRGTPLADLRTEWAQRRREQMERSELVPAQYALVESELALGEHVVALRALQPLMDQHPLDETFARQWIQATDGLGRFTEATSFYTAFRQRMIADLGIEPGLDLREAHQHVLRNRSLVQPPSPVFSSERTRRADALRVPAMVRRRERHFTGRGALIAQLDARLLDTGRDGATPVIALHGMPGVGKTSLATQWAHLRGDRFPGGQLFVDLNGYGLGPPVTADDAATLFLTELGVPPDRIPDTGEQRRAELGRLLADRRALAVLDNARDAPHVRPLLSAIVACPVIVTSRAQLTGLGLHDGAEPITVQPLTEAESTTLLRHDIGPAATADDTGLRALVGVAAGLPLALRLIGLHVAGHCRADLMEVVREIADHVGLVDFLDDGGDDEVATLPGVFSWSYRALPAEVARLFRLLGLHPKQTFSSQLASALASHDLTETERLLRSLTRVHLLESAGRRRYRLHDLLHAYANRCVRDEESPAGRSAARARMVDWYLRTGTAASRRLAPHSRPVPPMTSVPGVTALTFDTEDEAQQWSQAERANVLAITHCAAEHGLHGYAWRILGAMSDLFDRAGYADDYLAALRVGLDSAARVGDRDGQIGMLNNVALAYVDRRDYQLAAAYLQSGLSIAEELGQVEYLAVCQFNLANVYASRGDVSEALQLYRQSLRLHREMHDAAGAGYCLHRMARLCRTLDQHDKALDLYHQALAVRERAGHLRGQGATLTDLGMLHYARSEYTQALDYCVRALRIHEQSQDLLKTVEALATLAAVHFAMGAFVESAEVAQQAVGLCQLPFDAPSMADALQILGHAQQALGDHDAARARWSQAVAIFTDLGRPEADTVRADLQQLDAGHGVIPAPRSASSSED